MASSTTNGASLPPPPPPTGPIKTVRAKGPIVAEKTEYTLLVLDADPRSNWYQIFKGAVVNGKPVKVEQSEWALITLWVDANRVCHCQLAPSKEPIFGTTQKNLRDCVPDFLLIRQFLNGLHGQTFMNTLMGFMVAGIPSVNSLQSIFFSTQRAANIAELMAIQKRVGKDKFPLVPMTYFPNTTEHIVHDFTGGVVAKVGTSLGGYGKMKFGGPGGDFNDFSGTVALYNDYITLEPFVTNIGDIRVQKIGNHIRAYHRVSSHWKGNVGEAEVNDVEVTDEYRFWVEEASKVWGGLDILSIDALKHPDGKHTILEMNDSPTGLNPYHRDEDNGYIREVVLQRMNESLH
ncbi:synapsin 2A [Pelomyxa schiedti]|nr:synapsin 2A [Pelomyxa schiedti]